EYEKILYKACLDSIPKGRFLALQVLTEYDSITTKGLAIRLGYGTDRCRMWLEELNVLGLCERDIQSGSIGDKWELKPKYKQIMSLYSEVVTKHESLLDVDYQEIYGDSTVLDIDEQFRNV